MRVNKAKQPLAQLFPHATPFKIFGSHMRIRKFKHPDFPLASLCARGNMIVLCVVRARTNVPPHDGSHSADVQLTVDTTTATTTE